MTSKCFAFENLGDDLFVTIVSYLKEKLTFLSSDSYHFSFCIILLVEKKRMILFIIESGSLFQNSTIISRAVSTLLAN